MLFLGKLGFTFFRGSNIKVEYTKDGSSFQGTAVDDRMRIYQMTHSVRVINMYNNYAPARTIDDSSFSFYTEKSHRLPVWLEDNMSSIYFVDKIFTSSFGCSFA